MLLCGALKNQHYQELCVCVLQVQRRPIRLAPPACLFCRYHDNADHARPTPYGYRGNAPFFLADASEPGVSASWYRQVDCGSERVCVRVCVASDFRQMKKRRASGNQNKPEME